MPVARLINLVFLVCVVAGCSRSQKTGASISAQDIAKAMPEFKLTPPQGAVNAFLETDSRAAPITTVYFKMTVPRNSVSNFLWSSGFKGEFISLPAQKFPANVLPLPRSLNVGSALSLASDASHASEWDLGKRAVPMRMTTIDTFASSAPGDRVLLMIYVDDSNSSEAPIYFQYLRVPNNLLKRR